MSTDASQQSPIASERAPTSKQSKRNQLLVLAAASAMSAIGLVAMLTAHAPATSNTAVPRNVTSPMIDIRDDTPEATAESFYDAWRKRAWDAATHLSVDAARDAVTARQSAQNQLSVEELSLAQDLWNRIASAPLQMRFTGSERTPNGVILDAVAGYTLMGEPYAREFNVTLRQISTAPVRYVVAEFAFGRVLSEPSLLRRLHPEPLEQR